MGWSLVGWLSDFLRHEKKGLRMVDWTISSFQNFLVIMFFCRDVFLDLLFIWMTTLVADKSLPFMFDSEPGLTHNQLVAKKQFIDLDRNRNGVGRSNNIL